MNHLNGFRCPDCIEGHSDHRGHLVHKVGQNRYECHTCKQGYREVKKTVLTRRKLVR